MSNRRSRRDFLRLAATSVVGAGLAPSALAGGRRAEILALARREPARPVAPNDRIGLATIGMGIIGFIDTDTALRVPGVELVAAADAYDARLARVKEVYGPGVDTTRDYREVLARPDVDAVIIAVPDHWHARMAIEAMEAGKDVYLEKPMVKELAEGPRVIEAQERTGRVLQVGSQFASDVIFDSIGELLATGAIGEVNQVEAAYNRNSAIGAWQYSIPPNVSEGEVAWEAFLGDAPRRPFDPVRFFRWRNYQDYGTAVAGDLFVHLFTGIHKVLNAVGPTTIFSRGGLRFWKDGRDVPDVILGLFEYPETEHHAPFTLSLQSNFVDGGGGGSHFRFIGSEGVIRVREGGFTLEKSPRRPPPLDQLVHGYNSVGTWSEQVQREFIKAYETAHPAAPLAPAPDTTQEYRTPAGYDARYDHLTYFFGAVRQGGGDVFEDAVFGYRAAAPALMANLSLWEDRIFRWDPVRMRRAS
jgi:predicted dehydrogenase